VRRTAILSLLALVMLAGASSGADKIVMYEHFTAVW